MKEFFGLIFSFSRMREKYSVLKDTDEGEKVVAFGVRGILCALVTGAMLVVCYFAFGLTFASDWRVVIGFILLVVGAAGALLFFLYGVCATLLQLKLNKRAVGFISLFFQIAAFAGAIAVVLVVNHITIL